MKNQTIERIGSVIDGWLILEKREGYRTKQGKMIALHLARHVACGHEQELRIATGRMAHCEVCKTVRTKVEFPLFCRPDVEPTELEILQQRFINGAFT